MAPRPARTLRRSPPERLAAWLYTGPLGQLYGTALDIVSAWASWGAARLRARRGR